MPPLLAFTPNHLESHTAIVNKPTLTFTETEVKHGDLERIVNKFFDYWEIGSGVESDWQLSGRHFGRGLHRFKRAKYG
jgi:hypothetical protein